MRLIVILSLFIASSLQFQSINNNIKSGVYKWKSNFISNYPSYELNFKIKEGKNRSRGLFKGKSEFSHYYIKFDSKEEKNKHKNVAGIFGFSDGIDFYLPSEYCEDCDYQDKVYYKANFIGKKYLYYECFIPKSVGVHLNPNTNIVRSTGSDGIIVVSLKKRDKFILSKKTIKERLKNYPELYEQFKSEKNKKSVLEKYLKLLDDKN